MAETYSKKTIYMGIDFAEHYGMVSYYTEGMASPETLSTIVGGNSYKIPYGFTLSEVKKSFPVFLKNENAENEVFSKWLILFHKIVQLRGRLNMEKYRMRLAITTKTLDAQTVEMLRYTLKYYKIEPKYVKLMEYSESYFNYTYHQSSSIWQNQVALFSYEGNELQCTLLERDKSTLTQKVFANHISWTKAEDSDSADWKKDSFLAACMQEVFQTRIVSGVYLIGEEFDMSWMKETKRIIGANKRTFMGLNIYTKGACYAAMLRDNVKWPYVFVSDYKTVSGLRLKAIENGEDVMLPMIDEGENWFDCDVEYMFMLRGSGSFEVYQYSTKLDAPIVHTLSLANLPGRPEKTLRFTIHITAENAHKCAIRITDTGFGDFYPSSGRVWDFEIDI